MAESQQLDAVSQVIGMLSAQVQGMNSAIVDLRSEILTNRAKSDAKWESHYKVIDSLQLEYRDVKNLERELLRSNEDIRVEIKQIASRVVWLETLVGNWRNRAIGAVVVLSLFGTLLMTGIVELVRNTLFRWTH